MTEGSLPRAAISRLLRPRSVAVIGASDTPGSLGQSVFANLLAGNFKGKLFPVNLHHTVIGGKPAVKNINEISEPIDLAVVTTPMRALPDIVKACVKKRRQGAVAWQGIVGKR